MTRFQQGDDGQILWPMMAILLLAAALPLLQQVRRQSSRQSLRSEVFDQSARDHARASVELAFRWFRAQGPGRVASDDDPTAFPYPDAAFFPRESTGTVACCTLDEDVGLVEEHEIDAVKKIWVRMEVRRQSVDPSSGVRDPDAVHDITALRYPGRSNGEGKAWEINGVATVYVRVSSSTPWNVAPNRRLSRARSTGEIRYVELNLPQPAALWVESLGHVTGNGTITGGVGIGVAATTGTLTASMTRVSGSPATFVVSGGTATVEGLFGVSLREFKELADRRSDFLMDTTNSGYQSGSESLGLGMMVYTVHRPRTATGNVRTRAGVWRILELLDADRNVKISGSTFSSGGQHEGVLVFHSTATLTIDDAMLISGAVVVVGGGRIVLGSATNETASIVYHPGAVDDIRRNVAGYRMLAVSERTSRD